MKNNQEIEKLEQELCDALGYWRWGEEVIAKVVQKKIIEAEKRGLMTLDPMYLKDLKEANDIFERRIQDLKTQLKKEEENE